MCYTRPGKVTLAGNSRHMVIKKLSPPAIGDVVNSDNGTEERKVLFLV